jgi:nucleotide-binding universal stress UspA family protein
VDGRYIVGIDGSAPSDAAVAWACRRAVRDGAELVLAHVNDSEAGMMGHDFAELESHRSAQLVADTVASVRAKYPTLMVSSMLLEGSVSYALGQAVTVHDILVVGTHKTGFLHGRVLGSRSVQIATVAVCSVAVVPIVDLRFRTGVVVGIDRLETAGDIAALAAREAGEHGDELVCIHSVTQGSLAPHADLVLARALEAARAERPELVIRSRQTTRAAAEALLDASRDKALLVLGPGATDPVHSPIGSVLHTVLLNENAPVLIVRPTNTRELVVASGTTAMTGS